MSSPRHAALATFLETLSGVPSSIDYPDNQYRPPDDDSVRMRVRYIEQRPDRITLGGSHREKFEMTVTSSVPAQLSQGLADDMARAVQAHFASDTRVASTGETLKVLQKPAMWAGYYDPKRTNWHVPVSIYLEALPA